MAREVLSPKVGSNYSPFESQYLRGTVAGKFRLFCRWATKGEGILMSKDQLPTASQWARVFKGDFQGSLHGRRGQHAETARSADSHLEIGHNQWSDQWLS